MTEPVEDPAVAPLVELMLACYAAEIKRVARPPASVCLRTGSQVDLLLSASGRDECCEGLAWVRLVDAFPSSQNWPQQDRLPQPRGPAMWAVVLELGAARCAPVADASSIPTCQAWTNTSLAVLDDLAAARRAVCCFATARSWRKLLVGNHQPLRTEGGCVGGTLQVTVQAPACDCVDREVASG